MKTIKKHINITATLITAPMIYLLALAMGRDYLPAAGLTLVALIVMNSISNEGIKGK